MTTKKKYPAIRRTFAPIPATLYHYTTSAALLAALREGELRLTRSGITLSDKGRGARVVWLTSSEDWNNQPWARAAAPLNKTEVRVALSVPPEELYRWPNYAADHKMDRARYYAAVEQGNDLRGWYVTARAIPASEWNCVEWNPATAPFYQDLISAAQAAVAQWKALYTLHQEVRGKIGV